MSKFSNFMDAESLLEHAKAGAEAEAKLGGDLFRFVSGDLSSIPDIVTDGFDTARAAAGIGADLLGMFGTHQCKAQFVVGEAAATPILDAAAWVLLGYDRMTGGPFNADEGGKFKAGSEKFAAIADDLAAARPSDLWTGTGADAYRDRCDEQRRRALRMKDLDSRLAAIVKSESELIQNAQRLWDVQATIIGFAVPVALELMLIPFIGIVESEIFQAGVAAAALFPASATFFAVQAASAAHAAQITAIANEYQEIAASARLSGGSGGFATPSGSSAPPAPSAQPAPTGPPAGPAPTAPPGNAGPVAPPAPPANAGPVVAGPGGGSGSGGGGASSGGGSGSGGGGAGSGGGSGAGGGSAPAGGGALPGGGGSGSGIPAGAAPAASAAPSPMASGLPGGLPGLPGGGAPGGAGTGLLGALAGPAAQALGQIGQGRQGGAAAGTPGAAPVGPGVPGVQPATTAAERQPEDEDGVIDPTDPTAVEAAKIDEAANEDGVDDTAGAGAGAAAGADGPRAPIHVEIELDPDQVSGPVHVVLDPNSAAPPSGPVV